MEIHVHEKKMDQAPNIISGIVAVRMIHSSCVCYFFFKRVWWGHVFWNVIIQQLHQFSSALPGGGQSSKMLCTIRHSYAHIRHVWWQLEGFQKLWTLGFRVGPLLNLFARHDRKYVRKPGWILCQLLFGRKSIFHPIQACRGITMRS